MKAYKIIKKLKAIPNPNIHQLALISTYAYLWSLNQKLNRPIYWSELIVALIVSPLEAAALTTAIDTLVFNGVIAEAAVKRRAA